MLYKNKEYLKFLRRCKNQTTKLSQKKLQNATIILPIYTHIQDPYFDSPGLVLSIFLLNSCQLFE